MVGGVEVAIISSPQVVRSTGTRREVTIVHTTEPVQCCEHQQGWSRESRLFVWDESGMGSFVTGGAVQCGRCGSLVWPVAERLLIDADEVAIATAINDVVIDYWEKHPIGNSI